MNLTKRTVEKLEWGRERALPSAITLALNLFSRILEISVMAE